MPFTYSEERGETEWEEECMPSSLQTKEQNKFLENVCHSSLKSVIFNIFLTASGTSDTLELFDDYRNMYL